MTLAAATRRWHRTAAALALACLAADCAGRTGAEDTSRDGAAAEAGPASDATPPDGATPPDAGAGDAGPWTCDPAAMPLPNEGLIEEPGTGGCPAGMVLVDAFCIDRFEASLEGWSPYFNPPGTPPPPARALRGAVPQAYISGAQAAAACAAAGKRLCTDAEWLRACQGPSGNTYPYGDTLMPGICNDARDVHPAVEYFGTTDPSIWSMLDHPCLDQLPDSLDRSGDNPGCVTAEGVYDLMGNLHEWTADPAGTFRGGFYVDTVLNGPGCLYATTAHDTAYWDYSTGFRCCADP
ncbi:MAG TPA: SUMF1/EgtB/PvdO family nonheme iron enzyme [Myxococcota bacterium]|nr:SUMF1/EgtB/PvdO family nonheme iron enzyme [Myxococcota bacterium]